MMASCQNAAGKLTDIIEKPGGRGRPIRSIRPMKRTLKKMNWLCGRADPLYRT